MALLELPTGATRTGLVRPDLDLAGTRRLTGSLLLLNLTDKARQVAEKRAYRRAIDRLQQFLEHPEGLRLIGHQRIALRQSLQPDALAHIFHRREIVDPLTIDRAQHQLTAIAVEQIDTDKATPAIKRAVEHAIEACREGIVALPPSNLERVDPGTIDRLLKYFSLLVGETLACEHGLERSAHIRQQ